MINHPKTMIIDPIKCLVGLLTDEDCNIIENPIRIHVNKIKGLYDILNHQGLIKP